MRAEVKDPKNQQLECQLWSHLKVAVTKSSSLELKLVKSESDQIFNLTIFSIFVIVDIFTVLSLS